jgi:hypothetical protein
MLTNPKLPLGSLYSCSAMYREHYEALIRAAAEQGCFLRHGNPGIEPDSLEVMAMDGYPTLREMLVGPRNSDDRVYATLSGDSKIKTIFLQVRREEQIPRMKAIACAITELTGLDVITYRLSDPENPMGSVIFY